MTTKHFPSPVLRKREDGQEGLSIETCSNEFDQAHAWLAYLESRFTQLNAITSRLEGRVVEIQNRTSGPFAPLATSPVILEGYDSWRIHTLGVGNGLSNMDGTT